LTTCDQLQQRQKVVHRADPFLVDENDRILQHDLHPFRIGDEVRRQIAAIELHAFDDVERGVHAPGFFDGDDPVLAYLLHGFGDEPSNRLVVVRRDGSHLGDHRPGHGLGHRPELRRHRLDRLVDPALDRHGAGPGGDVLRAFSIDRLRQHRRRRGAVSGHVGRLARHFLHHLRAHVLERVLQLDLLRDRDAVLGDGGGPELPVEDHVSPSRSECDLDGVRQAVHSAQNPLPRRIPVHNLFCHSCVSFSLNLFRERSSAQPAYEATAANRASQCCPLALVGMSFR
jgi:hypothetical protein